MISDKGKMCCILIEENKISGNEPDCSDKMKDCLLESNLSFQEREQGGLFPNIWYLILSVTGEMAEKTWEVVLYGFLRKQN